MSTAKQKSITATEPYFRFSALEKQHFLAVFIENMTIAVRDAYLFEPEQQAKKLKEWNELLHRLVGNLRALLAGSPDCFPDDVLFAMIRHTGGEEPFRSQIEWAVQDAYKYVEKLAIAGKSAARKTAPAH
ncbi:MAG TPA: hypothetical protein VH020_11275 [Stellaceae bacterium]|jgi:hypothetical protein|nr:hypothetical protein [Stellaceae bacterium]